MNATLDHIETLTANVKTFWFKPERDMHQVAGQFTELYLPHPDADDRGQKRWFTLSNSPTDSLLSITTKYAGDKSSSFKRHLFGLQPGAKVSLADPMGDFVLPKDESIPLVYVAGGIGITPMHSMIKYLKDSNLRRDITLIYGVNTPGDLVFDELFRSYPMKYIPIAKEAEANWQGETGAITTERIMAEANKSDNSLVYISGPEPMLKAFADSLKEAGLNKRRIVTDFFPGYSQL